MNTNFPTLIYGRVYAIKNMVNGKLYIGQTVKNLKNRLQCHFSGIGNSGAPKLVRAIKKYGKENFSISHLDSAQGPLELDLKESFYIDLFKTIDHKLGYNIYTWVKRRKRKTYEKHHFFGKKIFNEDQKEKMRDREHRKFDLRNPGKVFVYSLSGEFLGEFIIREAAKFIGSHTNTLKKFLEKGFSEKNKTIKKHYVSFINEFPGSEKLKTKSPIAKKIVCFNSISGEREKVYDSGVQAGKELNCDRKNILRSIKTGVSCAGKKWAFENSQNKFEMPIKQPNNQKHLDQEYKFGYVYNANVGFKTVE